MSKYPLSSIPMPEWGQLAEEAVRWLPGFSSWVLSNAIFVIAPHQRRVRLRLLSWDKRNVEASMRTKRRRLSLRKKTSTTDFAAAGELAASLVLIRNVSIFQYTIQLKELNVVADVEAGETVMVSCSLDPQSFAKLHMTLTDKGEATIHLLSKLVNTNASSVAQVRSVWLVKKRQRNKQ